MPNLTPAEKERVKVAFAMLVVALTLQKIDNELGSDIPNPAVAEMTNMIDNLLEDRPEETREAMVKQINNKRVRLTKKVKKVQTASALMGAIEVAVSAIKSKPGTRLDFILTTLRSNAKTIKEVLPDGIVDEQVKLFKKEFKEQLFK